MIILDTNIVSELMRPAPESRVLRWFSTQATEDLHITAITVAEILYGIELASAARRRDVLRAGAEKMFEDVFGDHVLTFEDRAAGLFADRIIATAPGKTDIAMRCRDCSDRPRARSHAGYAQSVCIRGMRREARKSVGRMTSPTARAKQVRNETPHPSKGNLVSPIDSQYAGSRSRSDDK